MRLKVTAILAVLVLAGLTAAGSGRVAAQSTTSTSSTTTSTTAPLPAAGAVACARAPVGWQFSGSTGGVFAEGGFTAPISGSTGYTTSSAQPTVANPGLLYSGFVVEVPGHGTYSQFASDVGGPNFTLWLVNESESLPFLVTPLPDHVDPAAGIEAAIDTGDAVYIRGASSYRGGGASYRWRFDGPCAGADTPPEPVTRPAAPAPAQVTRPAFTG